MTHKIVSLRVYKDEYPKSFILFLSRCFKNTETENAIILEGITEEVATSIMSLMFHSEGEIQKVFPQYKTLYDVEMECRIKILKAFEDMRDAIIELSTTDPYKVLSDNERAETFTMMGLPSIQRIATEEYNKFTTHKLG